MPWFQQKCRVFKKCQQNLIFRDIFVQLCIWSSARLVKYLLLCKSEPQRACRVTHEVWLRDAKKRHFVCWINLSKLIHDQTAKVPSPHLLKCGLAIIQRKFWLQNLGTWVIYVVYPATKIAYCVFEWSQDGVIFCCNFGHTRFLWQLLRKPNCKSWAVIEKSMRVFFPFLLYDYESYPPILWESCKLFRKKWYQENSRCC